MKAVKLSKAALLLSLLLAIGACTDVQSIKQTKQSEASASIDFASTLISVEQNRQKISQNWQLECG